MDNTQELKNILNKSKNSTIENNDAENSVPKEYMEYASKKNYIPHENIELPSKGLFYKNKISKLDVEYLTSIDEDILTTPSLLESNKAFDILLKRKVLNTDIDADDLLTGDRNAILLFLRTSAFGFDYTVQVNDPRDDTKIITQTVDLSELKFIEIDREPDENGYFSLILPKSKKTVLLRHLSHKEIKYIEQTYNMINNEFKEKNPYKNYNSLSLMKIKAQIISIDGNSNRSFIDSEYNVLSPIDSLAIKRDIVKMTPGIDMTYEFVAEDGYKFKGLLMPTADFFFPEI